MRRESGDSFVRDGFSADAAFCSRELWRLRGDSWSAAAFALPMPRTCFTACLLPGGDLFVAGGRQWNSGIAGDDCPVVGDYMKNQPAPLIQWHNDMHKWSAIDPPQCSDGSVYPTPPHESHPTSSRYNADRIERFVNGGCALALPNGRVLVLGGVEHNGRWQTKRRMAEYDPQNTTWRILEEPGDGYPADRDNVVLRGVGFSAQLLPDGRVLVAGGFHRQFGRYADSMDGGDGDDISISLSTRVAVTEWASVSEHVLVFNPASDAWDELPPMPMPRAKAASCVLPDGRVALFGGWTQHGHLLVPTSTAIAFDTRHNKWTYLPPLPSEALCIGMCVHHAAPLTGAIAAASMDTPANSNA